MDGDVHTLGKAPGSFETDVPLMFQMSISGSLTFAEKQSLLIPSTLACDSSVYDEISALQQLNSQQVRALQQSACRVVTILIGPPGTGKSKTVQAILTLLKRLHRKTSFSTPSKK